jgi:hypothetical protein
MPDSALLSLPVPLSDFPHQLIYTVRPDFIWRQADKAGREGSEKALFYEPGLASASSSGLK